MRAALSRAVLLALWCAVAPAVAAERPADPAAAASYEAALAAYEGRRYAEAKAGFEAVARQGVAQAQFMLGVIYEYGDGVEPSYADAARWYESAAKSGLTSAETRLGLLYVHGLGVPADLGQGRRWLERAARKSDPSALTALGDIHARGQGVPQSLEDAYGYYLLAKAAGGDEAAQRLQELDLQLSPGRRAHGQERARSLAAVLGGEAPTTEQGTGATVGVVAEPRLDFAPAAVGDEGLGGNAIQLLVPRGWTLEGRISWIADAAVPAALDLRVENAARAAYRAFPRQSYAWRFASSGASTRPFIAPRGYEARAPVGDAVVYLEQVFLREQWKSQRAEVRERQPLPSIARVVASDLSRQGLRGDVSAARVRIAYDEGGIAFEEDLFCVLTQARTAAGGDDMILWGPERLYGFRAPAGSLARHTAILEAVAASVRFDDSWWARYQTLLEEIANRPGRSRISEREMELFLQSARGGRAGAGDPRSPTRETTRLRINAAMTAEFARTALFLDTLHAREVALPAGYSRAWSNTRGEYRLESDVSVDPRASEPEADWVEIHAVTAR